MVDKLTPERRSANMRRIKSTGMRPEMVVRKLTHGLGYRYRLHRRDLPGKPDLVFSSRRKVIFVHGCFWHQHEDHSCKDSRMPKSRLDYWIPKFARNKKRDCEVQMTLKSLDWDSLVIWECETSDSKNVIRKLKRFLGRTGVDRAESYRKKRLVKYSKRQE